jgi:E3 ubiquitin-protein ligase RHA2
MSLLNELVSFIRFQSENCENIINIFVYTNSPVSKPTTNLSSLDIKKYKLCKNTEVECCICCDKVKPNEYIRELNCNHTFHKKCIDKWLKCTMKERETVNCPICRHVINLI